MSIVLEEKLIVVRQSILNIASEATEATNDIPKSLLKLRDVIRDNTLNSQALQETYLLIWKCDLIHLIVEELRNDFTSVHGQWYTAVDLARVLTTVCSGLCPQGGNENTPISEGSLLTTYNKDEVDEFYEMLLPTAVDSLLILLNNIHDFEHSSDGSLHSVIYLNQFEAVTDALIRFCSIHTMCIHRVMQSSYLLHLLVTDNHTYSLSVLTSLQELVKLDENIISQLTTEELQSILDELVYKIGGNDVILAMTSLKVLALFSSLSLSVFDVICVRYEGLSMMLKRWTNSSMDPNLIKSVSALLERFKVSDEEVKLYKAALVIQSGWRGYVTRMKLKKMKKGIVQLQQLYRKKKVEREREMYMRSHHKGSNKEIVEILIARKQNEQKIALLERLPAASFSKYLIEEKRLAAVKIQSWWRGERDRKRIKRMKVDKKLEESVMVIQRAFRRYVKKKNYHKFFSHQSALKSFEQKQELNSLEWYYSSREEQKEMDRKRHLLSAQLSCQCEQLLNMPSLASSTKETIAVFASGSNAIALMAERAHREELAFMRLPWWKREYDRCELEL